MISSQNTGASGGHARSALIAVSEATFGRQVLGAPLPVIVVFGAASCAASRALRPMLAALAAQHGGRLLVATISVERARDLAEIYGVGATPTLLVVRHGEPLTRAVGFLPDPLLRLLAEQVVSEALPPEALWSPLEATFEDLVLLPLLERSDAGSIVGLDFDASVAWPVYDWAGVSKAAHGST